MLPPDMDLETKAVLKACIPARAALAALNQGAELIPNPTMLINTLPVLEAKSSSEIENIVTTTDRLFAYVGREDQADEATQEALRYRWALLTAYPVLHKRPITTRTAQAVCTHIMGIEMQVRRIPGTALAGHASGQVIYTPPEGHDRILGLLANWERFMNESRSIDPLVRLAVGHYQFEAIHPFADGNGRTGRVLNSLFLVQEGLLSLPILYLSRYILAHKADYYRLLLAVTREHAWEPWLLYMLTAIQETAEWTLAKIRAIRTLEVNTAAHVRARLPKIYSHELIELIFEQPYVRIASVVERDLAHRQTAARHLKLLADLGVLHIRQAGRDKLFVHTRLLDLLGHPEHTIAGYA